MEDYVADAWLAAVAIEQIQSERMTGLGFDKMPDEHHPVRRALRMALFEYEIAHYHNI